MTNIDMALYRFHLRERAAERRFNRWELLISLAALIAAGALLRSC